MEDPWSSVRPLVRFKCIAVIIVSMRIFPLNFWFWYKDDLKKFLETPRSVLMGFILTTVSVMAYLITPWCLALLILPFLYSFIPAYKLSTSKTTPFVFIRG